MRSWDYRGFPIGPVLTPLALIFVYTMGKPVEWVWYAMMISTGVAFIIACYWLFISLKNLKRKGT